MDSIEINVVVVGTESTGKTSLVKRYVEGEFSAKQMNTVAINRFYKSLVINDEQINLSIFDTAGNERLLWLTDDSLKRANINLVCFDLFDSESFDRARKWIKKIKEANNSLIYLCGTKNDLIKTENDFGTNQAVIKNYVDGIRIVYMKTSSLTGENVNEIFDLMVNDYINHTKQLQKMEISEQTTNNDDKKKQNIDTIPSGTKCNNCCVLQ